MDESTINTITVIINAIFIAVNLHYTMKLVKTHIPVLDIDLKDLPPYENSTGQTELIIKNVGSAPTTEDLTISISCPSSERVYNPKISDYYLSPNETYELRINLDYDVQPGDEIHVEVKDQRNRFFNLISKPLVWKTQKYIK